MKYEGLFTCVNYIRKYFENFNKIYYESCKNYHPVFLHVLIKTNLFFVFVTRFTSFLIPAQCNL